MAYSDLAQSSRRIKITGLEGVQDGHQLIMAIDALGQEIVKQMAVTEGEATTSAAEIFDRAAYNLRNNPVEYFRNLPAAEIAQDLAISRSNRETE